MQEKNFMCQLCAKTFARKGQLNAHMRNHTGEKKLRKLECKLCDKKSWSSYYLLKRHVRSEHTSEKPHQCDVCSKHFCTNQSLTIHKRYHTGERPYKCSYCEKAFVTGECVRAHERIHTGERPYKCSVCSASFNQKSTLRTHMKNH